MRVLFTSAAETELQAAIEFYESSASGLGAGFLQEIEAAVERVIAQPLAWPRMSLRTRRCRTNRFPYGLFYQVRREEILILSVMDLRRDPERWQPHL